LTFAWLPMLLDPDRWSAMHYVGSLRPAMAAVVLTAVDRGRPGLRDLARRMTSAPPRWVLLAIGLPVLLLAVGAGLSVLLGNPMDPTRLPSSREYPGIGWLVIPLEIVFFKLALFWAVCHLPLFLTPTDWPRCRW
jgi:hypothetical protein